jgi:predicted RNase H-like HicB family nuclease
MMIDLPYSLVIEATQDPTFFGFYSPDLEGFSGVGHSIEDCLYMARWGMREHIDLLVEQKLRVPPTKGSLTVSIQNEDRSSISKRAKGTRSKKRVKTP